MKSLTPAPLSTVDRGARQSRHRHNQTPGQEQVLTYPHPSVKLLNGVTPAAATYLHRDGLGSVRAITDAGGVKVESALYKPFGEQSEWLLPGTPAPETKGWIGERFDADAGLQYLNARYYDPELALFLQPDWFEVTKAGVGTNRFSYSFNDPVNLSDPNGNAVYRDTDGDGDNEYVGQARDIYGDRTDDPGLTYRERTAMLYTYLASNAEKGESGNTRYDGGQILVTVSTQGPGNLGTGWLSPDAGRSLALTGETAFGKGFMSYLEGIARCAEKCSSPEGDLAIQALLDYATQNPGRSRKRYTR